MRSRRIRKPKRRAHPDSGTDPFHGPDLDEIWWGQIDFDDDFGFATSQPPTEEA